MIGSPFCTGYVGQSVHLANRVRSHANGYADNIRSFISSQLEKKR